MATAYSSRYQGEETPAWLATAGSVPEHARQLLAQHQKDHPVEGGLQHGPYRAAFHARRRKPGPRQLLIMHRNAGGDGGKNA